MKLDKFVLAQNMAFLISIPLQSNLAKLLSFCLVTKARQKTTGTEILKITCELMENPSNLPYWTQDVMGLDLDYSSEEWKAFYLPLQVKYATNYTQKSKISIAKCHFF